MKAAGVLALALAMLLALAPDAGAQAPAPKVTITGLIDNVVNYDSNQSMQLSDRLTGGLAQRRDDETYAGTRGASTSSDRYTSGNDSEDNLNKSINYYQPFQTGNSYWIGWGEASGIGLIDLTAGLTWRFAPNLTFDAVYGIFLPGNASDVRVDRCTFAGGAACGDFVKRDAENTQVVSARVRFQF